MMKPAKNSLDLGIIASDIKASLHFYQTLLGLEFVGTTPLWFGTMHRLRFGESDFKLIEPKEVPPGGAIGLEKQLGFRYVTFVIENLSVVIQVGYFKYTRRKYGEGRRIFLMSPIHHHFQKQGIPEPKIVTRFWIIGIILAVIAGLVGLFRWLGRR